MIEFFIPAIHCASCASSVKKAVGSVDSAARVEVDLEKKSVHVDSALPPSDFVEALEEVGFPATVKRAIG